MDVEIKYTYRDKNGDDRRDVLTDFDIIATILHKNGKDIDGINIYKTKVGE